MRPLLSSIFIFLLVAGAGCHCSPSKPIPVTLRVNNSSTSPVYVNDTDGKLGLSVQRNVGGTWFSFLDTDTCSCLSCSNVCDQVCNCKDGGTPFVRAIGPSEVESRTWTGVVQVAGSTACNGMQLDCLDPENAPGDETFNLHFCFQTQVQGIDLSDGGRGMGTYSSQGETCEDKQFHPDDGVVEVGPFKGASCTSSAECRGGDQLCLNGSCTSGCPDNGIPMLGASWALRITPPDNQGFFNMSTDAKGRPVLQGTGTITSVTYQGQTMVVSLTEADGGTGNTGKLYVQFPPGFAAPLVQDTHVTVTVIDASSMDDPENLAVVIRDPQGNLLLAADAAEQGAILTAADTAPFTVQWKTDVVGCAMTACGKLLYVKADIVGPGMESLIDPGSTADQVTASGTYRVLNVSSGTYQTTTCTLTDIRPYAVWFLHN
ncbi:MAG: hypothetical protein QM723_02020 [Myxococcaceae bacterium]